MSKLFKKLAKRNKAILIVFAITNIVYLVSYFIFTNILIEFNNIENLLRYSIIVFLFVYFLFYFIYSLIRIIQKKNIKFFVITFITILLSAGFLTGSYYINKVYNIFSSFGEVSEVNYTVYLLDKKGEEVQEEDVIGIISEKGNEIDNMLSSKLLTQEKLKNETIEYDDYFAMMDDFYNGEIDSLIVTSNYITLFSNDEKFANIQVETEILYEYSEKLENEDRALIASKDFSEPITFLLMGIDSDSEGIDANTAFNGDTLMLITFNPHTLNATMLSIPRDTLVPIACRDGAYAKINSSAAYGTDCVINTVENLTDVAIDYYVKINFKGVVELVDALGGINVYIEEPDFDNYGDNQVCEQDSSRSYSNLICVNPGMQLLNGEQALAYSRNRMQYIGSDIDRTKHQQDVVNAITNKVVQLRSFDDFEKIINTVSNNIFTNMTEDQIFSAYDVFKDILVDSSSSESLVNIEKSYLEVYNLNVYIGETSFKSSALGYYNSSLEEITKMMNINLELEEPEIIKTASFSVNENYQSLVAGEGETSGKTSTALPSFIGESKSEAQTFCSNNGISCEFVTVDSESDYYNSEVASDLIGDQNVRIDTLVSSISKITFYINGEIIKQNTTTDSSDDDELSEIDPKTREMIE